MTEIDHDAAIKLADEMDREAKFAERDSGEAALTRGAAVLRHVASLASAAKGLAEALEEAIRLREALLRSSDGTVHDDPGLLSWKRALADYREKIK